MVLLGGLRYCRVTLRTFWLWFGVDGLGTFFVSAETDSAWPTAFFLRRYAPVASETGRTAPRKRSRPGPPPQVRPRSSSGLRQSPGRSRRNPASCGSWPGQRRRDRAARMRRRCRDARPRRYRQVREKRSSSARSFESLLPGCRSLRHRPASCRTRSVMHHLDEMPSARGPGVDVAALGPRIAFSRPGYARYRRVRAQEPRNRIEVIDSLLGAADHHAIAALDAPDAARCAAVHIVNAFFAQVFGAADVILVIGISAVNDDVAPPAARRASTVSSVVAPAGTSARWRAVFRELLDHVLKRSRGCRGILGHASRVLTVARRPRTDVRPSSNGGTWRRPFYRARSRRSSLSSPVIGLVGSCERLPDGLFESRQSRCDMCAEMHAQALADRADIASKSPRASASLDDTECVFLAAVLGR